MCSTKKDFIGRAATTREGLVEAGREQLIGLIPVGAVKQLTNGAHLYNQGADPVRRKWSRLHDFDLFFAHIGPFSRAGIFGKWQGADWRNYSNGGRHARGENPMRSGRSGVL